jgi:hypothetical protein
MSRILLSVALVAAAVGDSYGACWIGCVLCLLDKRWTKFSSLLFSQSVGVNAGHFFEVFGHGRP